MENTSQSMELANIEVDLNDDTLTVIPTPRSVESVSTENTLNQHVNVVSPTRAGVRVRDGASSSENAQYQKKERQKTSKV